MHNNYHFLARLAPEIEDNLEGATITACFLQAENELVLEFTKNKQPFYWKADFQPWMSILSMPTTFARAKRNTRDICPDLIGCKVKELELIAFDRVLVLHVSSDFVLVFTLTGSRSNVFIYNNKSLVFALKPKLQASKELDLSVYGKPVFVDEASFSWSKIKEQVPTLGPLVYAYLESEKIADLDRAGQWQLFVRLLKELENGEFYICRVQGEDHLLLFPFGEVQATFSSAVEALSAFSKTYLFQQLFKKESGDVRRRLEQEIRSANKYLATNQHKLDAILNRDSYKELADVIMANLHAIPSNTTQIRLFNFYTNKEVEIEFTKREKPQKTAERYYRKAKNEQKEVAALEANLLVVKEKLQQTQAQLERLATITDLKTLRVFFPIKEQQAEKVKKAAPTKFKTGVFQGFTILIGRNAKNNDELTLKAAKKDDLWLHAKDVSGSHVVVKYQSGKTFPKPVVEYAAQLAAYYSKRKTDSLVPVIVTPKKFVRKAKGAAAGSVIVEKEKVLLVSPSDLHQLI